MGLLGPFRVLLRFYSQFDIFYFHSSKVLCSIYVFEAPSLRCHSYLHDVYSWKLYFMYSHHYYYSTIIYYSTGRKLKFKLRLILAIFKSILEGWFFVVGKTWSDCNFSIHLFLFKLEYSNLDNRLFWFEKTFFIFCLINFQPVILSTF